MELRRICERRQEPRSHFNGLKGTGKTIGAKILSNRMGIPVILVNAPYNGLLDFIQSLCFECVVLIDEAEKTFHENGEILLKMIDGVYNEKRKLYLLTTNNLYLDSNLLGRPGRIRYFKQFGNLNPYVAESVMDKPEGKIEEFLTHELFHILTRSSLTFKEEVYKIIGFTTTEKVIDLMALNQRCRFVSNPDVSKFCSYITLKDFSGKEHRLMMTTLARSNYNGGSLSRYILPYFLKLDDDCNVVTYDEKLPRRDCLYGEFYQDFITKVGKNTGYMTNPEEILAANFRFAVLGTLEELPNPEIIDDIRYLMRG